LLVVAVTHLNSFASERIPFTEDLLRITNLVYVHHIAEYKYRIGAAIEYMENHLKEFHNRDH
jgi:hypothetical protein